MEVMRHMNSVLYLEINLFALFVLCVPLINIKKNPTMTLDDRLFRMLLLSVMLLIIIDTCGQLLEGQTFSGSHTLLLVFSTLYFVQTAVICMMWMMYSDYLCFQNTTRTKKLIKILIIPASLLIAVSLTTPLTKLLFTVDSANRYTRGPLFGAYTLLCWSVLPYSFITALMKARREPTKIRKTEFRHLALYSFLPMLCGMLQIFFGFIPIMWISSAGSLLLVFVNLQNRQISLDGLTNINNRRTLDRFIETRYSMLKSNEALFLLLLDIDNFKSINDTFGHSAGDTALIVTAEILKKVCSADNYFLGRFGGDEFAIVFVRGVDDNADDILTAISEETERLNKAGGFSCPLSFSAGYASLRTGDSAGVEGLISTADRWMYKRKRRQKNDGSPNLIPTEKM